MKKLLIYFIVGMIMATTNAFAIRSPFHPKDAKLITAGVMLMASGKVMVGDSTGIAKDVALSGDITITNAGVTTIGAGAITGGEFAAGSIATADLADNAVTGVKIAAGTVAESDLVVPTADGNNAGRMIRAVYDVAVDLGTIGAHLLGVSLPANSIITRSWFFTVTQFVDAGSGTVALSCEDADNILAAVDITGIAIGAKTTGVQDDAIANFTGSIAASCELTATVAVADQTAGKLILFVEYTVVE